MSQSFPGTSKASMREGVRRASPVVCRACGAKVREDRVRCLRCGASLSPPQAPPPAGSRQPSSPLMLASAGAVVLIAGAVIFLSGRPSPDASRSQQAAPAPERAASEAVSVIPAISPAPIARSMDLSRGAVAAYARGDIAGSLEQFRAAVEADPNNPDALNNLGQVLVREGRPREAIPHFDRAIAQVSTTWAYHFNRARALTLLKEWAPAIAGYRDAVRLFPDDYVTAFNLARALQESGDLAGAIAEFERAIALAPGEADFHLSHAYVLERAQRPREAAAAYRRYLELQEAAPQAEKIQARITQLEGLPTEASPAPAVQ